MASAQTFTATAPAAAFAAYPYGAAYYPAPAAYGFPGYGAYPYANAFYAKK